MAKAKSSKSKIDIKKFLLEKGEKVGLIVAGVGLALLAIMGIMAASKAASPSSLTKGLKDGTELVDTRLRATPDLKPPERQIPEGSNAFRLVKVTEFPTPYPLFNIGTGILEKRVNPQILPPITGQAIYAIGGIGVYEFQDNMIAVIEGRKVAQNNIGRFRRPKGMQPPAGGSGAAPSTPATPTTPAIPVAPAPAFGGGGGGGAKGGGGPGGGPGAGPKKALDEKEIVFKPIDSKDIESAALAVNLKPERMAVVRAVVPYSEQVERYLRSLRLDNEQALVADKSAPVYRGFDVERLVLEADGKTVREDWRHFDFAAEFWALKKVTAQFESEEERFRDFQPDIVHELYLPRPKFEHGGYSIPTMPILAEKLGEMNANNTKTDLTSVEKKLKGIGNIFDTNEPAPGTGAPKAGSMAPPQMGGGKAAVGKGGPGSQPVRKSVVPVWVMQFIDPTIEPGLCYRYRVRLKAENPNFGRKNDVASPGLAEVRELISEWFEIPDTVVALPEEYLYADGDRHLDFGVGAFDVTKIKYHKWTDYIRVTKESSVVDPIAEWVIADIDARRGQFIHQEKKAKIPLWSMVAGNYILRNKISIGGKAARLMENVNADFTPKTPTMLVDFEGGKGPYRLAHGTASVTDERSMEILLLTDDGKTVVVTSRSTAKDREIADKKAREESWKAWLQEVERNTQALNQ